MSCEDGSGAKTPRLPWEGVANYAPPGTALGTLHITILKLNYRVHVMVNLNDSHVNYTGPTGLASPEFVLGEMDTEGSFQLEPGNHIIFIAWEQNNGMTTHSSQFDVAISAGRTTNLPLEWGTPFWAQ
jgi:hypothetical protein